MHLLRYFFDIFPRKNLLISAEVPHPFNPDEFSQEELPPPPGARSSTYEEDRAIYSTDPWILLKFPEEIMGMDGDMEFPDYKVDRNAIGYEEKKKWDI